MIRKNNVLGLGFGANLEVVEVDSKKWNGRNDQKNILSPQPNF